MEADLSKQDHKEFLLAAYLLLQRLFYDQNMTFQIRMFEILNNDYPN
jgi:hypothetical protein